MFSPVIINKTLTKERFGYDLNELSNGSNKRVVVECENCRQIIERPYKDIYRQHQCPSLSGNQKRCHKCETWKDLSLFNKAPKLSGGVSKMCRKCYNEHPSVKKCEAGRRIRLRSSFKDDLSLYLKTRISSIKSNSKKNKIPFDLDIDYIRDIWTSQGGMCYYSGLKMESCGSENGFQGWFSPSLDRMEPSLGYIKGNVVWCCFSVNSFKQRMPHNEFLKKINEINWKKI